MKNDIPTDKATYAKIVQTVSLRMQASADFFSGKRERMRIAYDRWHRYPARPVDVTEEDSYEIQLGYGFGIVEQVISKITEPLMNMGIPFGVFPTELGDQGKSDNFADICRDFYGKPHVQMGKRKSKKEMGVTGSRVEIDEWLHVVENGKRWGKVPQQVEQPVLDDAGQPVMRDGKPVTAKLEVMVAGEVPAKIVTHYGFNTRYPSVFNIYPEPNRTTIDTGQATDISWVCEDLGELALEDMVNQVIYDPETKQTRPRYDFTSLINDAGEKAKKRYANILEGKPGLVEDGYGPIITPVRDWADAEKRDDSGLQGLVSGQTFEDRDKIWVAQMRMKNEIVTVAQGKYIIERVRDPWHRPRIGMRIECYTIDPRSIWGIGVIDPIMDELDELDITHSLGMQNLFRLVNKMTAVKQNALVSMDDLDPRAGGIVRINDEVEHASQAVHSIVTPNAIPEMLAGESNTKGNIEFASSYLDGQPGIMGTKATHKTARGQEILQSNLNTRFATMQAQGLINEALLGQSMLYFFEQFAWEAVSYSHLDEDGATTYSKFTKDDVDTDGRGFRFLVTVDPLWGNTQQQRQDAQQVFELGLQYKQVQTDPNAKTPDLAVLFEDLLRKHGRRDLSRVFIKPNGEISPDQELQVLMGGGVVDGCRGDIRQHMMIHILQAKSPNLAKAMEAGKADPETAKNLIRLVQQAGAELGTFLQDPQAAADRMLSKAGARPQELPE